jgi:hypothetical protein
MNESQKNTPNKPPAYGLMLVVLLVGLGARWFFLTKGNNYDFDSYRIVADLAAQGKNIYANTSRYNYGPVWFNMIHLLDVLAGHSPAVFRWLLLGLLSAVDAGIAWLLWRKVGRLAGCLFFLNPVSIMITGYHNQFDNLAVLLGLASVIVYGDDFERPINRRKFGGLMLLGLSLMTKHVLFIFPLWLAVKQKGWRDKCVTLAVPVGIFLLGFAPYWAAGKDGIINNVFKYHSLNVAYFQHLVVPEILQPTVTAPMLWILVLAGFAILCRRRTGLESLLIYTAVMVATAPATMNQYLAIPSAFTSVFVNAFTVPYTLIATFHVASDMNGPHLWGQIPGIALNSRLAIYCLLGAVIWTVWHDFWLRLAGKGLGKVAKFIKRLGISE